MSSSLQVLELLGPGTQRQARVFGNPRAWHAVTGYRHRQGGCFCTCVSAGVILAVPYSCWNGREKTFLSHFWEFAFGFIHDFSHAFFTLNLGMLNKMRKMFHHFVAIASVKFMYVFTFLVVWGSEKNLSHVLVHSLEICNGQGAGSGTELKLRARN